MSSFEPERRRDGERIQGAVDVANKLLENSICPRIVISHTIFAR